MNYYEIIYLKNSLKQKIAGSKLLHVVTPHKNVLELQFGDPGEHRLVFSASPDNTALFLDVPRPSKKRNALTFFESCYGSLVIDVDIAENDRWLTIGLENDHHLVFRLFSHKANVLLIHKQVVTDTFKDHDEVGNSTPEPRPALLFENSTVRKVKDLILQLNPMFPREELDLFIALNQLEEKNSEEIKALVKQVHESLLDDAQPRLLRSGELTLMPENLLPTGTEKTFDSVNDLIAFRYKTHSKRTRVRQQKGPLLKDISRKLKRVRSSLKQLEKADDGLEKAERYEQIGHILMANAHLETEGAEELRLTDLFNEGTEVNILIDPRKTISANAEEYYRRSRQSLQSYEQAVKRVPQLEQELEEYQRLSAELGQIHDLFRLQEWVENNQQALADVRSDSGSSGDQTGSPFHILREQGKEIWIGKNAHSNDKLLRSAHKEDIWLHARGVPGSHVVIRMANNKEMPGKEWITKAASYAAFYSKAKGSALVPVIYTKCKFVRKPKGAAPGAVLVQKENVEMAEPFKPDYE